MEISGRRTHGLSGGQSSAEDGEIFCQLCSSDGDWVVAMGYCQNCNEYFCSACLRVHRKQSMSRNHVILEGKSMPKSLVPEIYVESCSELCTKHTNEIVKFYCFSHDVVGCGDCMVLEHKACKVERIQDISCSYFNGPEHTKLLETVGQFLQNLEDLGTCIQLAEEDMNETYTRALVYIKTFRKEVNIYLDKAEAEIMDEMDNRKEEIGKTISELETDKISVQYEIKELDEKLKLQSNKANELFVAAKQIKDRTTAIDISIKQMFQKGQTQPYTFEPSSELKQIVSSEIPLGILTKSVIKRNPQNEYSKLDIMEPQFDGEINVKTHEDKADCFIIASAIISPSQIVLADYQNKCLKMVDIWRRKLFTRHELCSSPTDVAVVSRNLILVTLSDKQEIKFLSITQKNTLTESHDINVNGSVRKIAYQNDTLIIWYTDTVEILNLNGNVVKTISLNDFSLIEGIALSHDSMAFYVSNNYTSSKLYQFDFDGKILASYKDETLQAVRGLTVTPDGTVLVCNWTISGGIHMISPACKKIKEILQQNEHVQYPWSVSFCSQTNKLFLSNFNPKLKNVLKIFQMM